MNKYVPRIDWRATFLRLCAAHGGDPLTWRGELLFRDGWRHLATNHRGPERAVALFPAAVSDDEPDYPD